MRSGQFLISLSVAGMLAAQAIKVDQDADAGSDLSFLADAADATAPAESMQGTDLSAMFANFMPTPIAQEAPPVVGAAEVIQAVTEENSRLIEEIAAERAASDEAAAMIGADLQKTSEDIAEAKADIAAASAAVEKAGARIDGEPVVETEEDIISSALFDLNAEELATLYAMEEEIQEETGELGGSDIMAAVNEIAAIENAEKSLSALQAGDLDSSMIAQWEQEMAAIEQALIADTEVAMKDDEAYVTLDDVIADEIRDAQNGAVENMDELDAEFAAEEASGEIPLPASNDLTGLKIFCKDTTDSYVSMISDLKTTLASSKDMSDKMATSLANIDPNMENGGEGKAFIRKMYKLRNKKPAEVALSFPVTAEPCVNLVAGKVLQLEDLQEMISAADSFRDFFAHVYCAAYVNALVTMKDGLYQIFPGGLDQNIQDELQRLYGPLSEASAELDAIEIASVESYFDALQDGLWKTDDSSLISVGEPMSEAMALCAANVNDDVALAEQDRQDYLNDLNFLNYLKSL